MFEQIKSGDSGISLDTPTICLIIGWVPFIIAWGHYNTAFTEWLVQAYFITGMLFINYPRHYERKSLGKAWFRKAILLAFVLPHPAILSLMWFIDVAAKSKWREAATMMSVCAVTFVLDGVVLLKIVKFFRPASDVADTEEEVE